MAAEPTDLVASDLADVLALNQAHVPHVGPLDERRLAGLLAETSLALGAHDEHGELEGFVLVLGPGADYDSPNYQWFAQRHDDFLYVDRIVVRSPAHRSGLGRRLYAAVFDHARAVAAPVVTAEVNVDPPNPVSSAFHESMGFAEVGRQETYGVSVTVALMAAPVG